MIGFEPGLPIKEHDPCKGNGVSKHIQRFKRILNWAVEIEWIKANPFEKYSCPLKKSKRKKLTVEEISTTQIYAYVDEEKIMDDMTGIEAKMDKKREMIVALKASQKVGLNITSI